MGEGQALVLNSTFWGMISYIKFYRKMISLSVQHSFNSVYTAFTDTIGGHYWANKL